LISKTEIPVRFNEADPLGVVWHGHYLRFFEDGREAFGKEFGLTYMDFYAAGLAVPVVSVQCDYKRPLKYGDVMIITTIYKPLVAAKLLFTYEITAKGNDRIVASGSTTQVFVDAKTFALHLTQPLFYETWRKKWKV
jgi:acyl-CoA thioester hydrolase